MADKKQTGGLVLYPLVYNIDRESPEKSTVICKGIDNAIYLFNVNPPESAVQKAATEKAKSVPKLVKLAETHAKAVNPCHASLDNGRDNPHGIFVGEQITLKGEVDVDLNGVKVKANVAEGVWCSVVRDGKDGYRAPIGYGYLEVNFHPKMSPQGNEYLLRYNEVNEILSNEGKYPDADLIELTAEKARLSGMIKSERSKWFVGVLVHCMKMITLRGAEQKGLRDVVQEQLLKYTANGVYGGVIVRAHKDNVVQTALCKTCEHRYVHKERKVDSIENVMDDFMRYFGNKLIREAGAKGLTIDIIPVERFNAGGPGNERYSTDVAGSSSKVMKTYVDNALHEDPMVDIKRKNGFLYSRVAMRLAKTVDGSENYLLSSIHSFSRPIGSILCLDRRGELTLRLDTQKTKAPEYSM
ncbi:MAG: hypothetical protein RSG77_09875 [Hafnia sp.]